MPADPKNWMAFEELTRRYDAWFDSSKGQRIFQIEVDCLRWLLREAPRPWLEIGVGTGRFATALDIDLGVDPNAAGLKYAAQRGIKTKRALAEELPFNQGQFGAILLVTTICFLENIALAFKECRRVVRPDGYLIIGFIPRDSQWGQSYINKAAAGHPFYSPARFYTVPDLIQQAEQVGWRPDRAASCLLEGPQEQPKNYSPAQAGIIPGAGFVGLRLSCSGQLPK